jgi:hypothetical protein
MKWFAALVLPLALLALVVACEEEEEGPAAVTPSPAATATATATPQATPTAEPTPTSEPTPTPTPTPRGLPSPHLPTPTPTPKYKLALISGKCTLRSDIGFTECEGFVENISGKTMENVEVVITWVDDDGVPQSSDEALIDYNPILAGQQSPWSTIGSYNPALTRFRVEFKELLGGTISYRDDRPQ